MPGKVRYQTDVVGLVQAGYTGTQPGVRQDILHMSMSSNLIIPLVCESQQP
jgi:hypothetical protein